MTLNKTDRIVITLGNQIVSGKYVPGSPLPAEAELCEEFETSRNIIREVFRSLMAKRLIEMKRYRGAFVAPRNQWNYLDTDVLQWVLENDYDPRLIGAMSEVRNLVEPAIARWAAERATSGDLAQIESALNDMIANNQDRDAFNEADIRYHEAVLQSVHNPVLQQLSVAISSLQRAVFERTWMGDEANMPKTLQEHKALFDAIRHQDSDAAEQAALTMIASSTRRLKGNHMTSRYIAIDWGSTNLRAWLYQDDRCLESRQSEAGVTRLNGKSPEAVLAEVTAGWRDSTTPVVMAGMVGSNVGWKIAPYLPVPAYFSAIGEQLTSVGDKIWIIPGLCVSRDDNHNVMRGEETQLLGARSLSPSSVYVMPGTHCKWVLADGEKIHDFRTVMTGELHHLLLRHSLVGAGFTGAKKRARRLHCRA
ncbi:GntR family transcriptional regulator [Lelliottia amnigena]|nr:GntR family transcriptional regulator [Lelliottia amnigena]